jgi:hypothetical protein
MTGDTQDELMWAVRHFIYQYIVEHEQPPSVEETATGLAIGLAEAENAYRGLHERHAILLKPGSLDVRIANPFSGVPTAFLVHANGHTYWANCAWDTLGIAAALHSDARIEAVCADTQTPAEIHVEHGAVRGNGEVIHLPVPYRNWHDDLVRT